MFYEVVYRIVRNALPGRILAHRYPYMFTPAQLVALIQLLDEAVMGNPRDTVVEVGCAAGNTTVFFAYHLAQLSKTGWNGAYHAYDTFSGFVSDDVAFETRDRTPEIPAGNFSGFRLNKQRWVQDNLDRNADRIVPVVLHCRNASTHDFAEIERAAFVLIDVDIYKPTENALMRLWPKIAPGGLIVFDDCWVDPQTRKPVLNTKFSGGHDALLRFAGERGLKVDYVADKLAVLRKRPS
jgi:O-methyltransferase